MMLDLERAIDEECVLACIDSSPYAAAVVQLAAWSAQRLNLPLEILHVVQRKDAVAQRHDWSGAIGLGGKSTLLEEMTTFEEHSARLEVERGRALLRAAGETAEAAGAPSVRLLHRHGGIVENVLERETHARAVVIGKRGASHAFAVEHVGSKLERVVRASRRPVLVAGRSGTPPTSLIVAHDGSEASNYAIDRVLASPIYAGLPVTLLTVGKDDERHRTLLDEGAARLGEKFEVRTLLLSGSADIAISELARHSPGAMLVMGAYGHSRLRTLIVGSTTTAVMRIVDGPVLLVRRPG